MVVNKIKKDFPSIVLISRKKEIKFGKEEIWCLPKGKIELGETYKETAIREVEEETGIKGKIKEKIGEVHYWYYKKKDLRCNKTVHFYMMKFIGGKINRKSYEVENVRWFNIRKALENMVYKGEKDIVRKVKQKIER